MAYILGFIFADGSLENSYYLRGKYVRISSTDEDVIKYIKKELESEHNIINLKQNLYSRKTRYLLRIGSYSLYNNLCSFGLFPNKSLSMKFPKIPRKYLSDFIRGYFDGDGCVYLAKDKEKKIIKKISVIFTCGSKSFLEDLGIILKENIDLKHCKVYNSHRSFQLRYSTNDSIKILKFLYKNTNNKFYFKRKHDIFLEYLKNKK